MRLGTDETHQLLDPKIRCQRLQPLDLSLASVPAGTSNDHQERGPIGGVRQLLYGSDGQLEALERLDPPDGQNQRLVPKTKRTRATSRSPGRKRKWSTPGTRIFSRSWDAP